MKLSPKPLLLGSICLILISAFNGCTSSSSPTDSLPTESITPESVLDPQGDIDIPFYSSGFIDVVRAEASFLRDLVTVQIVLADLPEKLTFSQAPKNTREYNWAVYIDVDGDLNTGSKLKTGVEYEINLYYNSTGEAFEQDILTYCNKDVWHFDNDNNMWYRVSYAMAAVDYTANTLTLRGIIPGINETSRWFVETQYYSEVLHCDYAPDYGNYAPF